MTNKVNKNKIFKIKMINKVNKNKIFKTKMIKNKFKINNQFRQI